MKKIVFALSLLSMTSLFASEFLGCTCKFQVGLEGVPGSVETVEVETLLAGPGTLSASKAETEIVASYQCLESFNAKDIRKVFSVESVSCKL